MLYAPRRLFACRNCYLLAFSRQQERQLYRGVGNLPEAAWTIKHGSEFHVRVPVEVMDPQRPFEEQEEIAVNALDQIGTMVGLAQTVAKDRP